MSEESLKEVMRMFAQGVVVVTAKGDDGPRGITVSAFTSVTMTPPTILICIQKDSRAHAAIASGRFLVNVLGEDQADVSNHFATPNLSSEEQFAKFPSADVGGLPKLEGAIAYIECSVSGESIQGSHTVFFGEVVQAELAREGNSLVYCNRGYRSLGEPLT